MQVVASKTGSVVSWLPLAEKDFERTLLGGAVALQPQFSRESVTQMLLVSDGCFYLAFQISYDGTVTVNGGAYKRYISGGPAGQRSRLLLITPFSKFDRLHRDCCVRTR